MSSRMKVSRLTLSWRWLSSASFSVASSSMALLSSAAAPEEEEAAAATCSPRPDSSVSSSNISRCGSALAAHPGPKRAASPPGSMAPEPSAPPAHRDQQPTPSVASRCRPARVAEAAAVPPPAGARAGEGRAQCAGSPSTAPARAPVRPHPRCAPGRPGHRSKFGCRSPTHGPGRQPLGSLRYSPSPGVPGQAVWGHGAGSQVLAATLSKPVARGRPCLAAASA